MTIYRRVAESLAAWANLIEWRTRKLLTLVQTRVCDFLSQKIAMACL